MVYKLNIGKNHLLNNTPHIPMSNLKILLTLIGGHRNVRVMILINLISDKFHIFKHFHQCPMSNLKILLTLIGGHRNVVEMFYYDHYYYYFAIFFCFIII